MHALSSAPRAVPGARVERDPVREHVDRELAHVLGDAEVAAVEQRARLRGAAQRDRAARRHADRDRLVVARLADDLRARSETSASWNLMPAATRCIASTSACVSTGSSAGSAVAAGSSRSTAASSAGSG